MTSCATSIANPNTSQVAMYYVYVVCCCLCCIHCTKYELTVVTKVANKYQQCMVVLMIVMGVTELGCIIERS